MIINYIFNFAISSSMVIVTLKNSLELLITVDKSLDILRNPRRFSYILLVV